MKLPKQLNVLVKIGVGRRVNKEETMASNFTLFSAKITGLTKDEHAWLRDVLEEDDHDSLQKRGITSFCEVIPGFEWRLRRSQLDLWSEEYGNLDNVAVVVQVFLRKFRPDAVWAMQWAHTCSKPRAGESGGGAMVVTKFGVRWFDTNDWMLDVVEDPESWPDSSRTKRASAPNPGDNLWRCYE